MSETSCRNIIACVSDIGIADTGAYIGCNPRSIMDAPDKEDGLLVVANSGDMRAQKAIADIEAEIVPTLNE
jgi:hypothetical protein